MKTFLCFLILTSSVTASAFELMKCTSRKSGTIWASFGHLIRSGEDQVRYFPTEIVLFAPDVTERLLFPTLEEALKINMDVGAEARRVRLEFAIAKGAGVQKHLLRIFRYDPRITNGYMGSWMVSEEGQPDRMDEAACSLD